MTTTLTIGADLDGCVYRFVDQLRGFAAERHGVPLEAMPEATCWDFFADDWGWTTSEFLERFADGVLDGCIFWTGNTYPGAVETLQQLHTDGHRIHVITARTVPGVDAELAAAATSHWLEMNGVPYHELTISSDKAQFEVDTFIEDSAANYDLLEAAGRNPHLITRPWNASHDARRRVATWEEFYRSVTDLAVAA